MEFATHIKSPLEPNAALAATETTIGYATGLDTDLVEMSSTGRPFTIGNKGKSVTALF